MPFTYGPNPSFIACSQDSNRGSNSDFGGTVVTTTATVVGDIVWTTVGAGVTATLIVVTGAADAGIEPTAVDAPKRIVDTSPIAMLASSTCCGSTVGIGMFRNWGATPSEISGSVAGDELCADARVVCTRSITIASPPAAVFPWIRQMGFGRAGWYSYDWIDNLGRRSATSINSEWQDIETGSLVPGRPISFEAAVVEPPRTFVLPVSPKGRMEKQFCFTLAYELRDDPAGTRLVTQMRTRTRLPGGWLVDNVLLAPGDGVMVRKQLLTLAQRSGSHTV